MTQQTNTDGLQALPFEPNLGRALDLVMTMMAIPGKTGHEGKVAAFITEQLRAAGAPDGTIETDEANLLTPVRSDTGNLTLKLPGTMPGVRRMLSAHMDTVPLCVGSEPVIKGRTVHAASPNTALGADDRGGVAVILSAALEILERNLPHPPLTFCWFIQEETGLQGARNVKKSFLGDPGLAFNWDGGSPVKLCVGATGAYRIKIAIEGLASHAGAAPEAGVSAIAIASRAIADLDRNGWHGDVRKNGKRGTSNVGFIHGGEATNVVTDHVSVKVEARSHDADFRKQILAEIENAFRVAASEVKNVAGVAGKVSIDSHLAYESFQLAADEPSVLVAQSVVQSIGCNPIHAVVNGGLDSNWLFVHGIPSVTLGCGQRLPHTVHETLELDDFDTACRIALRLATGAEG